VNQRVVTLMLRREGYHVEVVEHGGEVLPALERHPFSLILMDVQMPLMDGLEAARLVRADERFRDLPIIAMTAHAMTSDRDLCLESGMDGYLSKPVERSQLVSIVSKHLGSRRRSNTPTPVVLSDVPTQALSARI